MNKPLQSKAKTSSTKIRRQVIEGREITSHGYEYDLLQDFYHLCLTASWPKFFSVAALGFITLNILFAWVYLIEPSGVANLSPPNFWGAFFFSVETLATVGYGDMHPQNFYVHIIATIEVFTGMASVAVLTGLIFARFSKPKSRVLFSDSLILSPFNGVPTLMLRVANARQNLIANATAKMHVLIREESAEGKVFRRIYDLDLARSDQPMFFLTWTIMHPITPNSPLFGLRAEDMQNKEIVFLLRIVGFDESIGQELQARKNYSQDKILWDHQFVDVVHFDHTDGATHIDYKKFHQTEKSPHHE
jgi:inward rectifier potassium channel